jgi:glutamyl-tRNA reductase
MQITVVGLSHHQTPVELRERFAFAREELPQALQRLPQGLSGAVLSTCNRIELYLAAEATVSQTTAIEALSHLRGEPAPEGAVFYYHSGSAAVWHLFRVAAGIDSLVVGESEILGQVREAFSGATAAGRADPVLARLFHSALRVGRRVRSETEIGGHGLSVSALAVALSRKVIGDLRRRTVLVVGAGEAGRRAAAALAQSGAGRLLVTTRRSGLAQEIASELNGLALPFEELPAALAEADVVLTCTSAPDTIISAEEVSAAMASRPQRPLVCVDIAVPRDIDSAARGVANVHLFDIDDLEAAAEANLEARKREVGAAEAIVRDELRRFDDWLAGRAVVPTIAALRRRAEATREAELRRTLARLEHLDEADRERIEAMSKALVKRLLHAPVSRLRQQRGQRHVDAVRDLFELEEP